MKNEPVANLIGYYALFGGLLAVALGYFVIRPALNDYKLNSQKLAVENAKIAQMDQAAKDTEALKTAYTTPDSTGLTIQQQRNRILAQLPASDQSEQLMNLLSTLGAQSGVAMGSFVPQGVTNGGGSGSYVAYPVNVNVTGTFSQIMSYLKTIEKAARFIDIQGVSASAGNTSSAPMSATLVMQGYYQQNPPSGVMGSKP